MKQTEQDNTWAWATGAVWLVLTISLLSTMSDYGLSWDEITRWNAGDNKLRYYEKVFVSEGASAWGSAQGKDLYPGLYDLPLAMYSKFVGGDREIAGHLYTIFFSVLGVIAAGMIGRELGGWRMAFGASLLLLIMPSYFGHLVFNPKDIPFAATYTWGLWGVVRCGAGFGGGKFSRWIWAGLFAGLAMASRLPGVIILAYLFGLMIYRLIAQSLPTKNESWRIPKRCDWFDGLAGLACAGLLAIVVLVVFFPSSHRNPFSDSVRVVSNLHEFSATIPVLFRGVVYDAGTTPWYYTPWMFVMTTPVWQLILLVIGLVGAAWRILNSYRKRIWWDANIVKLGTVVLGFSFPLIYMLLTQPAIHNGVRHFLFVYPAGAVLMAYGLNALMKALWWKWQVGPVLVYVVFAIAVVLNVFTLIRLHPYQYIYFNVLAGGPAAAMGYYETEYWFTSMGEGLESLQHWRAEQNLPSAGVRVLMTGPREIAEYQLPEGWTLADSAEDADYFLGNSQFAGHLLVDGKEIIVIERMGLPILVVKDISNKTSRN